jgi:hypothetical protein
VTTEAVSNQGVSPAGRRPGANRPMHKRSRNRGLFFLSFIKGSIPVQQKPEVTQEKRKKQQHVERVRKYERPHELHANERKHDAFHEQAVFQPPHFHAITTFAIPATLCLFHVYDGHSVGYAGY